MPNVGLFSAGEPLPPEATVSIRYTVEVDGLPVYTELYDVRKLRREWQENRKKAAKAWMRRFEGPIEALEEPLFSVEVTKRIHEV